MIHSMTAFARQEKREGWGSASCEIRSINHRYLEINLRLPENISFLEPVMRDLLRKQLQRGKIDCTVRYQPDVLQANAFVINKTVAEQLVEATRQIAQYTSSPLLTNVLDILRWPGVLQNQEADISIAQTAIMSLFAETVDKLSETRAREGAALQTFLIQRIAEISLQMATVKSRLPQLRQNQHSKLLIRLTELKMAVDPNRLEQELVLYAQKVDVTEEIDRISTHIVEVERALKEGGALGRRLDFLMQELNREVNTLGSKINDSDIAHVVVELKVLLEQMREQIQNIE
jgi:uncharacterized protein (TIGR00255 family)